MMGMLSDISLYNLPSDYPAEEQSYLRSLTLDQVQALAHKYIDASKMYYVIAGDAKTQLDALEKIGFGKPELVKRKD